MFQGTHDDLMRNNPEYRMMIMAEEQRIANEPAHAVSLSEDENEGILGNLAVRLERVEDSLRRVYNKIQELENHPLPRNYSKGKFNDYV